MAAEESIDDVTERLAVLRDDIADVDRALIEVLERRMALRSQALLRRLIFVMKRWRLKVVGLNPGTAVMG